MTDSERIDKIETRLGNIERTMYQVKSIAVGIAIGLVLAGVIFGIITLKEARELIP